MLPKMIALVQWVHKEQSIRIGGGVIIFVQSYSMQFKFKQSYGEQPNVFWEVQGNSDVLIDYTKEIKSGRSCVLVCVIGGKLSEGINFSDDLARTVIVFGLPFPNNQSASLKEKMKFYDINGT